MDKPTTPRKRKMPKATVEVVASAFFAAFLGLPGAIQWRIVQMIEAREDEMEAAELAADMAANPADYDPKNSIPFEQVMAELEARKKQKGKVSKKTEQVSSL